MTAALNVRDYACAKVRRRLDSYLAGELSVDLSHEILEHLDRCPECRAELGARERLRAATRLALAPAPEPREGFAGEVHALLERTPRARRWPGSVLLAASLLVAAFLAGWWVVGPETRRSPESTIAVSELQAAAADFAVANHEICTLSHTWPEDAPPTGTLESGLDPRLSAALRAAAPLLPGYAPVSAHECTPAGETVFHIVFRRVGSTGPGGLVSLLATRSDSRIAAGVRVAGIVGGGGRDGLAIAGTKAPDGRLLLLVTGRSEAETMALGRAVLPALATALAG
jgi:anti-sigma factor RsiW